MVVACLYMYIYVSWSTLLFFCHNFPQHHHFYSFSYNEMLVPIYLYVYTCDIFMMTLKYIIHMNSCEYLTCYIQMMHTISKNLKKINICKICFIFNIGLQVIWDIHLYVVLWWTRNTLTHMFSNNSVNVLSQLPPSMGEFNMLAMI